MRPRHSPSALRCCVDTPMAGLASLAAKPAAVLTAQPCPWDGPHRRLVTHAAVPTRRSSYASARSLVAWRGRRSLRDGVGLSRTLQGGAARADAGTNALTDSQAPRHGACAGARVRTRVALARVCFRLRAYSSISPSSVSRRAISASLVGSLRARSSSCRRSSSACRCNQLCVCVCVRCVRA